MLQQESAECGLACLAMISAGFGKAVGMEALRARSHTGAHGMNLQQLLEVAESLQLAGRPLRISVRELGQLQLPAILHWNSNHFVVLVKARGRKVIVHDPAIGRRSISPRELRESFTGIALDFSPALNFRRQKKSRSLSVIDFARSFRHLHRYLAVLLVLLTATELLALVPAIATQILIDEVVLGQDGSWLNRALAGLGIVMLLTLLLDATRRRIALYTGTRMAADSTVNVITHLVQLPVTFIQRRHLGDLMSKLESLKPLRTALTDDCVTAIVQSIVLLTTLVIMLLYSPLLTAISVGGIMASLLVMAVLLPATRRLDEQTLIRRAAEHTSLVETLRAYDTVQSLGLATARRVHWQQHFLAATGSEARKGKLHIARTATTGIINIAEQLMFLGVGIGGIVAQEITLGALFAFMSFRGRLAGAAATLLDIVQRLALLRVHTSRLSDIVLAKPVAASPRGAATGRIRGALRAEGLSFGYVGNDHLIDNFSCDIPAGSHVVIVGPSGCGKTTLLNLLAGRLDPVRGQVLLDGLELGLWNRRARNAQCSVVLQHDLLFQGTIAENIAAFAASPDMQRIRHAALVAEIWEEILRLPMQTDTPVAQAAASLSGGQVQRIILARALYRAPRILFLDEATSHLDVATEKRVLANVSRLDLTIVSVAHRPDAISLADKIIPLAAK